MLSIEDLSEYKCPECGKNFYVEYENSPSHCPFCMSLLSLNHAYITTYKCAITGATFTITEAHETGTCGALGGREQICAECENIIEK